MLQGAANSIVSFLIQLESLKVWDLLEPIGQVYDKKQYYQTTFIKR